MEHFFDSFELNKNTNLQLLASKAVEGFIIGLHKSPYHGFSVEFAEHRLYQPGESIRNIDWKVYGRTDKFFSKKYEEETNLRARIVIDVSSSMYFPQSGVEDNKLNKLQWACLASSALINLLKRQRDAFGISLFDQELVYHSPVRSNTTHQQMIYSQLESYLFNPKQNTKTSTANALHQIADAIHRRSMVIIFSDMLDDPNHLEPIFDAMQHLKYNKHEVILFHVLDKKHEINLDYKNRPYEFIDLETGEKIKLQSNEFKTEYQKVMKNFIDSIQLKALQYKIDYVPVDIRLDFNEVLQAFLIKRAKMMI